MGQNTDKPRPYDLTKPEEHARLLRELEGYMRVSLHYSHGTDHEGREHAWRALYKINAKAKLDSMERDALSDSNAA